jgi:hypothetical protein
VYTIGDKLINKLIVRLDAAHSIHVLTASQRVVGEVARLNRMFAVEGKRHREGCIAALQHWVRNLHGAVVLGPVPED